MKKPALKDILIVVLCTLFFTSTGKVLWKFGAMRLPDVLTNWPLLGGFVLHALAAVVLITLFKKGEVTILFPAFATNYIWVTLLSAYFFGEPLTIIKWAGIAFIIAGTIVLSRASHQHKVVVQ